MVNIKWSIQPFQSLTTVDLYDILALREEVFTSEQKCSVNDHDGLDKYAIHVIGMHDNEVIATARILPTNTCKPNKVSFGRLAIKTAFRGQGIGDALMRVILEYIANNYPNVPIEFSAQLYLKKFYEKYNFVAYGNVYEEGGIIHIKMKSK